MIGVKRSRQRTTSARVRESTPVELRAVRMSVTKGALPEVVAGQCCPIWMGAHSCLERGIDPSLAGQQPARGDAKRQGFQRPSDYLRGRWGTHRMPRSLTTASKGDHRALRRPIANRTAPSGRPHPQERACLPRPRRHVAGPVSRRGRDQVCRIALHSHRSSREKLLTEAAASPYGSGHFARQRVA